MRRHMAIAHANALSRAFRKHLTFVNTFWVKVVGKDVGDFLSTAFLSVERLFLGRGD